MEDKKFCEKSECEKCNSCCGMANCCMWQKCHMLKYLIWLIIIIIFFCLGAQYEKLKTPYRGHYCGDKMMNWNKDNFDYKLNKQVKDIVNVETDLPIQQ